MSKDLKELRNQRAQKLDEAQGIMDKAGKAGRSLSEEERGQFDTLLGDAENIAAEIGRHERLDEQRRQAAGKGVTGAELGMEDQEIRRFSVVRLINHLANPQDERARNAAGFEIEACQEAAKVQGKQARGIIVPSHLGMEPGVVAKLEREGRSMLLPVEVMARRGLTAGTPAQGGNLVANELLSGSFIDQLLNRLALTQLGVTSLDGLVGNVMIPRKNGSGQTYWIAENDETTPSSQSIGQVALSPKTIGALTDYSRQLMMQSSISVEAFVRADLARILGLGIDLAGIAGTGAGNQPLGVLNQSGIGVVPGGTNGAAPTWDHIVDLETEVAVDNADIGSLAYLTNARVRGKLKKTKVDDGSGMFVWDRLNPNTPLNGYGAAVSNQVPGNGTKGTGANLSSILFGNWADLVMGLWGGLDLLVDPFTGAGSGKVRVVAFQSVDFGLRHGESFAAMKDAITQ
ncbi:phage major capsid protein [Pseudomonas sp.]|uniref:phage major capsid protein n=1 Tax=Pseudomonas sp. TaxID=306 RepID=UPI002911AFFE|nr:phage major capsid protein [Pseudomonas sp.]MDU4255574.1 phage major capsid protein [Pseudomonas sp.]